MYILERVVSGTYGNSNEHILSTNGRVMQSVRAKSMKNQNPSIPGLTNIRLNYLMPYIKVTSNWHKLSSMIVKRMSI